VAQLFLAGYIPGIMLGISLGITCFIVALKRGYPREKTPPLRESLRIIGDGLLSLLTAVIIVVGIAAGVFTATEASAVAVLYAAFLGFVVYRGSMRDCWQVLLTPHDRERPLSDRLRFGVRLMMTYLQIPANIMGAFLGLTHSPWLILLMVNVLLLILGCVMDLSPLIVITTPVLLPVVQAVGMSPVTFGIVLLLNLGIGLTTPPVGAGLFVGCMVGKTTIESTSRAMLVLWPAMIAVRLCTYILVHDRAACPGRTVTEGRHGSPKRDASR
jgi:tripartite ATP-independent transporter DctM subunit